MTLIFWKISKEARRDLILWQWDHHKDEKPFLDLDGAKAPWEIEPPAPQIPVRPDMTEEELGKFIAHPPEHQEKVG